MPEPAISTESAAHAQATAEPGYEYRVVRVAEAVRFVAAGEWDMPDFQRRFVWEPGQVCALADSLWRNYPIGALLLWNARAADHGRRCAPLWIADGQQRLTSLCLMYGVEPPWVRRMADTSRRRLGRRLDLRFDVEAIDAPFVFAGPRGVREEPRLIPLARLLALDPSHERGWIELGRLAEELWAAGCCREIDADALRARLARVSMIGRRQLAAAVVSHGREGVLEVFARLNSRGMRFRRLLLKMAMEQIPAALRGRRGWCCDP
ncbi:MAG TPA: DUF262 domain-containing protein [Candidatus Binataceae bacterium]|nr:DUF262 domain-containing protein [Candidatus Binataceae bacterium]